MYTLTKPRSSCFAFPCNFLGSLVFLEKPRPVQTIDVLSTLRRRDTERFLGRIVITLPKVSKSSFV